MADVMKSEAAGRIEPGRNEPSAGVTVSGALDQVKAASNVVEVDVTLLLNASLASTENAMSTPLPTPERPAPVATQWAALTAAWLMVTAGTRTVVSAPS